MNAVGQLTNMVQTMKRCSLFILLKKYSSQNTDTLQKVAVSLFGEPYLISIYYEQNSLAGWYGARHLVAEVNMTLITGEGKKKHNSFNLDLTKTEKVLYLMNKQ